MTIATTLKNQTLMPLIGPQDGLSGLGSPVEDDEESSNKGEAGFAFDSPAVPQALHTPSSPVWFDKGAPHCRQTCEDMS